MSLKKGFATLLLFFTAPGLVFADGHGAQENVLSVQLNLCNLKDGSSMKDYDELLDDYFKWAKDNDVEVDFVRQTPLFTHATPNSPDQWQFADFLISDHKRSGETWDKWLGTKTGQKLNKRWGEMASCNIKFMALYPMYMDETTIQSDDSRVVSWDWCTPLDGVTPDQVIKKHADLAKQFEGKFNQSAWLVGIPTVGMAQASGYAHINVYKDFAAYQADRQFLDAEGGWRVYMDYQATTASCSGEALYLEDVLNRAN